MKIFLIINGHLLVVPIVFISFRLLFLTGRKGYGKKIMSASGPALLLPDLHYRFRTCIRDGVKKNGLFSDINHISFNTHPPPPNNDI